MYLCKKTICFGVWRCVDIVIVARVQAKMLSKNALTSDQGIV